MSSSMGPHLGGPCRGPWPPGIYVATTGAFKGLLCNDFVACFCNLCGTWTLRALAWIPVCFGGSISKGAFFFELAS